MNRRDFFKTSAVATATLCATSVLGITAAAKPKISWKDFDWMPYPAALAFRIEVKNGRETIVSTPYVCKTLKTKLVVSAAEAEREDWTQETLLVDRNIGLPKAWHQEDKDRCQTVYTNETLLLEAKQLGFTHLYMFLRFGPIYDLETCKPSWYGYGIRGAKLPEWKTQNGKLQVVNV